MALNISKCFLLNSFGLALFDQLFQGFEYPFAGSFLLESEHVFLVFKHEPETKSALVLEILFRDFKEPDFELVVVGFLGGFFLHIEEGRITADVTFAPYRKGFFLLDIGFSIGKVDDDLPTA